MKAWFAIVLLLAACGGKPEGDKPKAEAEASPEAAAKEAAFLADQARLKAQKDAAKAQASITALQEELAAFDVRVNAAVSAVVDAQTQADRDAATAKLAALRKEKLELEARLAQAKAEAARAERLRGVSISKECIDNPLAKGCS